MDLLARYVVRRLLARFALLLGLFLGVLAGGQAGLLVARGTAIDAVLPVVPTLVLLSLPVALPLAVTTATLVVFGALQRDGEVRALAACGIGHGAILARATWFVCFGVACSAALAHLVMPNALGAMMRERGRLIQATIAQRVTQRKSVTWQGMSIWASGAAGNQLQDVYLRRSGEPDAAGHREELTAYAPRAEWRLQEDGVWLALYDVQLLNRERDGALFQATCRTWTMPIDDPKRGDTDEPDAASTPELLRIMREHAIHPGKLDRFNNARLSWHLRLYLPLSLVAFALLAAGLGLVLGGADALFGIVVVVVVVTVTTYPAIGYAKSQIDHPQRSPALLLWPPAVLAALIGILLCWRPLRAAERLAQAIAGLGRLLGRR